ncbi:MAG: hypothetical protein KAI22_04290, partial [Gammaproteobacteria bacterium]|nr:hypothetical protein [Gammaproteobacteria bacterium]
MSALLQMLHRTHGFAVEKNDLYKIQKLRSFMEKALKDGVLSNQRTLVRCHDDIIFPLIMETIQQGTFENIKSAAEAHVPYLTHQSKYDQPESEIIFDNLRIVRMALFSRNDQDFLRLVSFKSYEYPFQNINFVYFAGIEQPFYPHVFEYFTPQIRYLILANALQDWKVDKVPQKVAVYLLMQIIKDFEKEAPTNKKSQFPDGLTYLLAEQYIAGGDFSTAEKLISSHLSVDSSNKGKNSIGLALYAKIKMHQGAYDEAIELYQRALDVIRKQTRKRKVTLPERDGIYYILALLGKNEATYTNLADQQIKEMIRKSATEEYPLLANLIDVMEGRIDFDDAFMMDRERSNQNADYILLWSLCRHWLSKKMSRTSLVNLQKCSLEAKKNGYYWYYLESQLILNQADKTMLDSALLQADSIRKKSWTESLDWTPLLDLIRPVPQWQRALSSLQAINQADRAENKTSGQNTIKQTRLTWRVKFYANDCVLEPREQVQGKNNKWSSGRAVSLQRLYEETDNYDYLTAQDKKMCRQFETEVESYYYGRHQKVHYTASGLALLKEAVGHPLLFLSDAPKQMLELTQDEVKLEIQSNKNQFTIKITPFPEQMGNYLIMQSTANKAQLIELSNQHQRIIEIVGQNGLTVPAKAKQQLLDTINAIAPLMTIYSDIAVNTASDAAKRVKANPLPQVHIQPWEDGLLFDCYTQPFSRLESNKDPKAGQGPLFRPGHGHAIILSEVDGIACQTSRDLQKEKELAVRIPGQCPLLDEHSDWHWPLSDIEDALETLLQLQSLDDKIIIKWPEGEKLKVKRQYNMKQMQVSLKKKKDWFELDGQLKLDDGQIIAMQNLFDLMQMSPGRFIQLKNGEFLALTDELKRRLSSLQFAANKNPVHNLNAPLIDELTDGMSVKSGKHWQTLLKQAEQARLYTPEIPSTLQAELRDYQIDGFKWLARLAQWRAGACLADDMGLGKTLQALALILTRAAQGPTLIIAPTSVCFNWIDEIHRFTPTLQVQYFASGDRQKILDESGAMNIIICSYGLLQANAQMLSEVKW